MPRYSIPGKTKVSTQDQIARSRTYRVGVGNSKFDDPFPLGFGTEPEKMVYAALSRRGIRFYYLNDIEINIPEIEFMQFFQADFILPDQRIIIEVQGAHWHSMPSTIEADALKFAYYQYMGWKPLAWWDFDILRNVNLLFLAEPLLAGYNAVLDTSSELTPMRRTKTDSSQGIRTLNQKRGARQLYKKKPIRVKSTRTKNYGGYSVYGK